jgi:hypothetical protein
MVVGLTRFMKGSFMGARNHSMKNIRRQISRLANGAKQLARDLAGWLEDAGTAHAPPAPRRAYAPIPVYSPEEERRQRARQRKRK